MSKSLEKLQTKFQKAVTEVANDPTTSLSVEDVPAVTAAVTKSLGGAILNGTNREPFYQSTIFWGLIIGALNTIAKPFIGEIVSAEQTADYINALTTMGQLVGFGVVAYGRFIKSNPLFWEKFKS